MQTKFTVLMLIEDNDTINVTLSNFFNTKKANEIELILLDISNNKVDENLLNQLLKNINIKYINLNGKSKSEAYNIGLQEVTGQYVNFLEQGDFYSKKALIKIDKCIHKNPAKIVCLKSVYKKDNICKVNKICPNRDFIDLLFYPTKINLSLNSYFINKLIINDIKFDESIDFEDSKFKFLLEVNIKYPFYYLIKDENVYYNIPEINDVGLNELQYKKEWYTKSIVDFDIPFLEKIYNKYDSVPLFTQEAMLYHIFQKYNCNLNERNKSILSKEEAKEFFEKVSIALKYIDTRVILCRNKENLFKIPRWLAYQFVLAKDRLNKVEPKIIYNEGSFEILEEDEVYSFSKIKNEHINVYAINYDKDKLEIDYSVSVQDFLPQEEILMNVKCNNDIYKPERIKAYPLQKCFDLTISNKCQFRVTIPTKGLKKAEITFNMKCNDEEVAMEINFSRIQSHLTKSKFSYWKFNDYYLEYRNKKLLLSKKNFIKSVFKEIEYMLARLYVSKNKKRTIKLTGLRLLYWLVYPVMHKKRIWIYYDKIYKAGDNAEYLYKYAEKQNDNIEHYYVINKESNDYKRLKSEREKILIFGSIKLKIYSLYAEAILATHKNVISFLGFPKQSRSYFKDLFNPEIICIQHGLTMQAIAQHQNRLEDNTKLYMCASKYEIDNLSKDIYGYDPESLKLVGLARFDGLINNDKRQIFIAPTWRKNAANTKTRMGNTREYTEEFKKTDYFKIFNGIINNKKLIECAKDNNYKIVFLLHPVITAQYDDFDKNDYVNVITVNSGISYETLLTESSLMVTDYSGIQYDFAYMRKKLIYFHPDELPAQYEDGGIDYETMGFGPICHNTTELIDMLCDSMKNECKIDEKYVKRADDFFKFSDHNNCKRIYDTVKKYLDERK